MRAQTLPDGFIWLGDAFERAWEAVEKGKRLVLAAYRRIPDPGFSEGMGGGNGKQGDPAALRERNESRRRVEKEMRRAFSQGRIRAFIRDPKTGEPGELADREKWWENVSFGVPGLATKLNHLTCPGPETGGQPVFVRESELQSLIRGLSPATCWYEHGNLIAETPWQLPAEASLESLAAFGTGLFLPLSGVMSFLAFGKPSDPPEMDPYVCASYRQRAATALFKAAGEGLVRLFGTCSVGGPPGFIPEAVFVDALAVFDNGASFDVSPGAADYQTFVRLREGKADGRRWLTVTVERASLAKWIDAFSGADQASKKRGGRPSVVNWPLVKQEALRILAYEGAFDQSDPKWNCQARLEERLLQFCGLRFGIEPAPSTLRRSIPGFIETHRRGLCET
jgi:hypothetical protein